MKNFDYDKRLAELGIVLPTPPKAYFSYVPAIISGNQLYISGNSVLRMESFATRESWARV
ncbi:hypothetical protein [Collimonas fungivorans]|uniref:hypothetical protein n=1 Tax=Collimonas fungivorans TaxID=158899 RepID=UPI0007784250|nr:hypothetical protein [Collimonas fungivorans]